MSAFARAQAAYEQPPDDPWECPDCGGEVETDGREARCVEPVIEIDSDGLHEHRLGCGWGMDLQADPDAGRDDD